MYAESYLKYLKENLSNRYRFNNHFEISMLRLVDRKSLALAYSKTNLKRQIIGVGLIVDSVPILVPMVLNSKGHWIGKL